VINRIAGVSSGRRETGSKEKAWSVTGKDVKQLLEPIETYVSQNPAAMVAAAFAAGVAIAWWIKRK